MIYKEYFDLTEEYKGQYGPETALVLLQVGSFYEMYGLKLNDELIGSNLARAAAQCCLKIADKKDRYEWKGKLYPVVMAGFGEASLDKYLPVLVDAGFSVAVYIQEDDMVKRGAKKRVFYGVFSAGTFLSETVPNSSNHIMVVWVKSFRSLSGVLRYVCSFATIDVVSGASYLYEYTVPAPHMMVPEPFDELERAVASFQPKEMILITDLDPVPVRQFIGAHTSSIVHVRTMDDEKVAKLLKPGYVEAVLEKQFGESSIEHICIEFQQNEYATMAFCYLLDFLHQHSPHWTEQIQLPKFTSSGNRLVLGNHTLKQLNILGNHSNESKINHCNSNDNQYNSNDNHCNSLLQFLDHTVGPMGKQAFQQVLLNPKMEDLTIEYDAIEHVLNAEETLIPDMRRSLGSIRHLERILRYSVHGRGTPLQIGHLIQGVQQFLRLVSDHPVLELVYPDGWLSQSIQWGQRFEKEIHELLELDPQNEYGLKKGLDPDLDSLQEECAGVRVDLMDLQTQMNMLLGQDNYVKWHETAKMGSSFQITAVRGKALQKVLSGVPDGRFVVGKHSIPYSEIRVVAATGSDQIQSGTVSTCFRRLESLEQRVEELQQEVWKSRILVWIVRTWMNPLTQICGSIKRLDILQSKAWISRKYCYCRPSMSDSLEAIGLRHPLIEQIQTKEIYVSNDIRLNDANLGILLYGTNAVGKTSLIKSVGLAVIMAQAGFYVAASEFRFRPYRAIYSRILGNDDLFRGMSTFVVEMSELRTILVEAGPDVLVLGDEVCSGTETESALSIMMASLRHLVDSKAHFLFATHFHELASLDEMEELGGRISLQHLDVRFDPLTGGLVYDRHLKPGPGPSTYGLEVAKSLYVPTTVLDEAFRIREKYFPKTKTVLSMEPTRYNRGKIKSALCECCGKEAGEEIHHIVQQKEADKNGIIRSNESIRSNDIIYSNVPFHKNHPANLQTLCSKCHENVHN